MQASTNAHCKHQTKDIAKLTSEQFPGQTPQTPEKNRI
jgi:hypothetical protein